MPMKYPFLLFQTDPGGSGGGEGGEGGTGDPGGQGGESQGDGGSGTGGGSDGGEGGSQSDQETARLRQEAAKYRTERNALQKKIDELEGAGKSEVQKLTDNVTKLTQEKDSLVERVRLLTVENVAGRVGIAPEARADAAALLPSDAVDDWSDTSQVEKALKKLVQEKPYLAGSVRDGADGGTGGNRDGTKDMNTLLRQAAGRG